MNRYFVGFIVLLALLSASCHRGTQNVPEKLLLQTNPDGAGQQIEMLLEAGPEYSHPLLAIWIETAEGKYVQTLYVSQSIAKGFFARGDSSSGTWSPGPRRRPAALPYWAFKRNVRENDGLFVPTPETALPDAYTGATPQKGFTLITQANEMLHGSYRIWLEINQPFDWNRSWTTTRFPADKNYATSGQPSLIYATDPFDISEKNKVFALKIVGHGHFSGANGELFPDVSGFTTALEIVEKASAQIR